MEATATEATTTAGTQPIRRLVVLVAIVVCVDTMLYTALTPLLPDLAHSKTRAGFLVAGYAAGALLGGVPGGFAVVRWGARPAVLAGLAAMGVASIGFGLVNGFAALFFCRLLQGIASGFTWAGAFAWLVAAAPRDRRGELIGAAMGAAVIGALLGPALGALAAVAGRGAVFVGFAGLDVLLGLWTISVGHHPDEHYESTATVYRAWTNNLFAAGLGLIALASLLSGVLSTLSPLRLSDAGWGATAIGALWLVSAAIEAAMAPLIGRTTDRRGLLLPVVIGLVASTILAAVMAVGLPSAAYAALIVAASIAFGSLFTPAFVLISAGAEQAGVAQALAFGVMNTAWAVGAVIGPAGAGLLASATSDRVPFILGAAICALVVVAAAARHFATATPE
jgi:MFS family permease